MRKELVLAILFALLIAGCRGGAREEIARYKTLNDPNRDTEAARKYNAKAVKLIKDDRLDKAEKELRKALDRDLFFGPAHNNLGNVYYLQKKYYLAAWEFQYAAKLMPGKAEPRNNLGLVYEAVGKPEEAANWYDEALSIAPESTEVIGNLARVCVRTNRNDDKTRELLHKIVMMDNRPDWINWAKERLALMGRMKPAETKDVGK